MANKNQYTRESYNAVMRAGDFDDLSKTLSASNYDATFGQYDTALQQINEFYVGLQDTTRELYANAYETAKMQSEATGTYALQQREQLAGATGLLGSRRYADQVNQKFFDMTDVKQDYTTKLGEQILSLEQQRQKAAETVQTERTKFGEYFESNVAKMSEYILSRLDPNVIDPATGEISASQLEAQGYVKRNADGTYSTTSKFKHVLAQFADSDPASVQKYREELFVADKDLYDFYTQYFPAAMQAAGEFSDSELAKFSDDKIYANEYYNEANREAYRETVERQSGNPQLKSVMSKATMYGTHDMVDFTKMSDAEQIHWAKSINTTTGTSRIDQDLIDSAIKKRGKNDYVLKDKTLNEWYDSNKVIIAGGKKYVLASNKDQKFGGSAEAADQDALLWDGSTEKLGTLVYEGKVQCGDTVIVNGERYLVTRADKDPDNQEKGGKHAADVRLIKLREV